LATDLVAVAYLNHGRWVAHCPRPGCTNAEGFGRIDGGPVGGLTAGCFECRADFGGCGLICGVVWPPEIAYIEQLVMCRPAPVTRNWLPGETLHDLLRENLLHGLAPNDELEIGGSTAIGRLPSFSRLELEG
jgi:hypothetical protein